MANKHIKKVLNLIRNHNIEKCKREPPTKWRHRNWYIVLSDKLIIFIKRLKIICSFVPAISF